MARDSTNLARQILSRLALRETDERLEVVRFFLESPGLSPGALIRELQDSGIAIHRRTVSRTLAILHSPAGALARWEIVGPVWVCWGCGKATPMPRSELVVTGILTTGLLPLDFGGYCRTCQTALSSGRTDPAVVPPGLRKGRSASAQVKRRALLVPVSSLYQNPALMRELLGSRRRSMQRDYTVANLVENPRVGPSALHRLLEDELPLAPTLRSVKRVSGALHSPKAQMLFSSLGAIGWSCPGCTAWGGVPDVVGLHRAAPSGFFPTDLRALCSACRANAQSNCHIREK